jgi:hypothetical protein
LTVSAVWAILLELHTQAIATHGGRMLKFILGNLITVFGIIFGVAFLIAAALSGSVAWVIVAIVVLVVVVSIGSYMKRHS